MDEVEKTTWRKDARGLLDMSSLQHGEVDCEGALQSDDGRILIHFYALFLKWDLSSATVAECIVRVGIWLEKYHPGF